MGLINYDENHQMNHLLVKELLSRASSTELTIAIEAYWQIWKKLDEQIALIEKEINKQAQDDPNESTYRSSPRIGSLSSRILSNELGDMSQFNNERELFSYTGLTPR